MQLSRLRQFQTSLSRQDQGLEEIAGQVVTQIPQFFHATETALELVEGEALVCCDALGILAGARGDRFPVSGSLSGGCLREMRPQRCVAALDDPRPDVRFCAQQGGRALLAIPVMDRAGPVGVLKMASRDPSAFEKADIDLAELLAGMTGLAIGQLAADKAAATLESHYRSIFESAKDGILMLDPESGRITDANPYLLELLGYTREELLQKRLWEIGLPRLAEASRTAFRDLLENGYIRFEDLPLETRAGREIEVEFIGSAYGVGDARFVQCILRDISDRKAAAAEVARLNAELEQRVEKRTADLRAANKELEAFSYSVSHDLRAPLRAIVGFSRILASEHSADLSAPILRYLEMIRANAGQMGALIDDLLAFSRLNRQPMARQSVDMKELVRRTVEDLWPEREGRRIELNIAQLPACTGDPAMLKQVWVNLISNALKYTRKREVAEITIDCREDLEPVPGRKVYFVRDNGVGFDPRYKNKLFGVFQRLHRAEDYEGTGVGLAVAQRIIRRHEGQIWAEAELNRGAAFFFTL